MDKVDVEKLLRQMDPSARMENDVADVLTDFAIDYIDAIVVRSCELAKHRGSKRLELADVKYVIKHYFDS